MFVDQVKLNLRAGKGGNGIIAWRREKFIPKGGPCGGDGGSGGCVIIEASHDIYALDKYRNTTHITAENGGQGGTNRCHGKNGKDRIILVPCGTLVIDSASGEILHDLTQDKQRVVICQGGKGGKGNDAFKTPTNRAPHICTNGRQGESIDIELELKMIADIGFVGMPNAGKSTLLSNITAHKVKIGDYPFTTLVPNLGFIQFPDFTRLTFADIPGLIQGAHLNKGLGFEFLKHIERTASLIFVLDASDPLCSPIEAFQILLKELNSYSTALMQKPFLVALNKCECEESQEQINEFTAKFPSFNTVIISAKEQLHLDQLVDKIQAITPKNVEVEAEPLLVY
ncbi:MAG: GTPase ObgE [Simkaniaceae bacterium]|nr:GTPase ObgE [Simkaniaceae bacterium]MCF7852548.1 GTPase ObgE [Simkaniaceae bacterium]